MKKLMFLLMGLRRDDWMHFTLSLLLAWAVAVLSAWPLPDGYGLMGAAIGFAVSMLAGLYKELVMDEQASWADLLADFVGAAVGAAMSLC